MSRTFIERLRCVRMLKNTVSVSQKRYFHSRGVFFLKLRPWEHACQGISSLCILLQVCSNESQRNLGSRTKSVGNGGPHAYDLEHQKQCKAVKGTLLYRSPQVFLSLPPPPAHCTRYLWFYFDYLDPVLFKPCHGWHCIQRWSFWGSRLSQGTENQPGHPACFELRKVFRL